MNGKSSLYALLIGINHYLPNRLADGTSFHNLSGCVHDILRVEDFLRRRLSNSPDRLLLLTSTSTSGSPPVEPREKWPTYENIVAAFKRLTTLAQPGDQVYIHYSGHGGRATTIFPKLKGPGTVDEGLVPMDIGNGTHYLRDVEIYYLLQAMVEKKLLVAVVLDSCHSGGATRGFGGATARGIPAIDTGPRPIDSLVASIDELAQAWNRYRPAKETTRSLKPGAGWLLEPKGYVLLSACRAQELAFEYPFDGQESNGALTYWLLDSLKQLGPGLTYKTLHNRILAKIHSQFTSQTPQLQGEGDRVILGIDEIAMPSAINIMQVDRDAGRALLNAGQAHGVGKGATFYIYPSEARNFDNMEDRLGLAEAVEVGAVDCWADLKDQNRSRPIRQGDQAVLIEPAVPRLRRSVRLLKGTDLPAGSDQDAALQAVEQKIKANEGNFVNLASQGQPADYQVAVNAAREYEIWDPTGEPIPNLRPTLRIDNSASADQVVLRLRHLTKYHNVLELENRDPMSSLARKLVVELTGVQDNYEPGDPPEPKPLVDAGNTPTLRVRQWTFLRICNTLPKVAGDITKNVLNIAVLNLQPDWGITQVYPAGSGYFEPLDPGQQIEIPLEARLPNDCTEGIDVLKVFATVGTTNFRSLELPGLDKPLLPRSITRGGEFNPTDLLGQFLVAVTDSLPSLRDLTPAASASKQWTTSQLEVRIERLAEDSVANSGD